MCGQPKFDGKTDNAIEMDADPSPLISGTVGRSLCSRRPAQDLDQRRERSISAPADAIIVVDDKRAKLADIKAGSEITARTADGQNAARAIRATSPPPPEKSEEPAAEAPAE